MGIQLKQAGLNDFLILERDTDIGGTWRDNDYPGCACDVPSHLYSFSFEGNPDWSRTFPSQPEIKAYLEKCAAKHGLLAHLHFNSDVVEARYVDDKREWQVKINSGEVFRARALVSGMGALSRPGFADIPGMQQFQGESFHSARWNHDCDLAGKNVAVIGTGASAVQFVPQIIDRVESLTLYQRTPPWVVPKKDKPIKGWLKWCFKHIPATRLLVRNFIYWSLEMRGMGFTIDPRLMAPARNIAVRHIRKSIDDEELRQRVTPNYAIGCKRILISNDYYPALQNEKLELVTGAVDRIAANGVIDASGREIATDVIIFATGFNATDPLTPMRIFGRGGRELADDWHDGPEAYLGINVAGYPNFFMLMGPNTGLGHNSMVFMIEAQIRYTLSMLKEVLEKDEVALDIDAEQQRKFNLAIQNDLQRTVWTSGCRSWYQTADGRHPVLWPGPTFTYWAKTLRPKLERYRRC